MFGLHNRVHSRIEQMWWRASKPPLLLRCMEPFYAIISRMHLQRRASRVTQPPLPMISVGNITAGGSGKTPFVLWLADALKTHGFSPVILCRGDGGNSKIPVLVDTKADAAMLGDEAKMLADLSGSPVIAAADRIAGSQLSKALGDVLILDDGFQYRHLGRRCDIVLVPAEGVGNGHQIPAGPLREPLAALQRADLIVRTGSQSEADHCRPLSAASEWHWIREPARLIEATDTRADTPHSVFAVTSIARPQRFFNDLKSSGLELAGCKSYPDHHAFTANDVHELLKLHPSIAVTAKDAVKLTPQWPKDRPLWLLPLSGKAPSGLIGAILQKL